MTKDTRLELTETQALAVAWGSRIVAKILGQPLDTTVERFRRLTVLMYNLELVGVTSELGILPGSVLEKRLRELGYGSGTENPQKLMTTTMCLQFALRGVHVMEVVFCLERLMCGNQLTELVALKSKRTRHFDRPVLLGMVNLLTGQQFRNDRYERCSGMKWASWTREDTSGPYYGSPIFDVNHRIMTFWQDTRGRIRQVTRPYIVQEPVYDGQPQPVAPSRLDWLLPIIARLED